MQVSLKEYCKSREVTYEAVRRQLIRYEEELGEHLIKNGRFYFLDEEAIAFLDTHRQPKNIVLDSLAEDAKQEIIRLREELEQLQQKYVSVLEENRGLLPYKANIELLEAKEQQTREQLEQKEKDLEEAKEELQETKGQLQEVTIKAEADKKDLQSRLDRAEEEASSYQKSWFGFYRKKG